MVRQVRRSRSKFSVITYAVVFIFSQLLAMSALSTSSPANASTGSPPPAPTSASIIALLQAVKVTWAIPANNSGSPITEFLIDLDSPDGTVQQIETAPNTTSFTFNTLYTGQTYVAYIYAISAAGVSPPALTQQVTLSGYPSNGGTVVGSVPTQDGNGYYEVTSTGYVFTFGDAQYFGSMGGQYLHEPIVSMAIDPATGGYWLVGQDGGVFTFNTPFYGSYFSIGVTWVSDVVGIAAVDGGNDYCVSESNTYIHCFGANASNGSAVYGSLQTQGVTPNKPISAIASTADGRGYWEVGQDGGVYCFGDAQYYGSMGGQFLAKPMVGMAIDPATGGYWLVGADGGIFTFNSPYLGSMGGQYLHAPMVALSSLPSGSSNPGGGYWEIGADGGVFSFGNVQFYGSAVTAGTSGGGNGGGANSNTTLWGVDSVSVASTQNCSLPEITSICLSTVDSQLGNPQFYGRYLTYGVYGNPNDKVLSSSEANYIHANNTKLLLLASPSTTNLTTASVANLDATNAINAAKALGAPSGTAIFRDIESISQYQVNSIYLETWTSDIESAGYTPGIYESTISDHVGGFDYAYSAAYNADPSQIKQMVLYASSPEPGSSPYSYGTQAGSPTSFIPYTPNSSTGIPVPNNTVAWQYEEAQYFSGPYYPHGPYGINVDVNEY